MHAFVNAEIILPLSLFMTGVFTNDPHSSLSFDDFAFNAYLFYRSPNFHDLTLLLGTNPVVIYFLLPLPL